MHFHVCEYIIKELIETRGKASPTTNVNPTELQHDMTLNMFISATHLLGRSPRKNCKNDLDDQT